MVVSKLNNVQDVLREHAASTRDKFLVTSTNDLGRIVKREPGNTSLAAVDAARKALQNSESDVAIWWRGEKNDSPHYMRHDVYLEQAKHPKGSKKKSSTADPDVMSVTEKRNAKDVLNQHSQIANALKQDLTGQGRRRLALSFVKAYRAMAPGEDVDDELTDDITSALEEANAEA